MNNMQKFAAQQLSKKQMNAVKGGQGIVECAGMAYTVECTYTDSDGRTIKTYGCANDLISAMGNAQAELEALGGKFYAHSCVEA